MKEKFIELLKLKETQVFVLPKMTFRLKNLPRFLIFGNRNHLTPP